MCANPAVPTDNHAAADNRARTDPTARSYLCSGLNHRQRPDLRRRIDARPLCDNCGRMNTGRNWWHGIEECGNARPRRVWFGGLDRHCPSGHSRCHIRMHDHSTGRCLIECRRITSIVQKTHFIRASRLQRGHTFKEQFEFIRNPACRTRNNCKRIWSTSAKEPCVTQSCFNHLRSHWPLGLFVALYARGVRTKNFVSFVSRFGSDFVVLAAALAQASKASGVRNHYARCAWRAVKQRQRASATTSSRTAATITGFGSLCPRHHPCPSRSVNKHHAARRGAYGGNRDGRHDAQSRGRAGM